MRSTIQQLGLTADQQAKVKALKRNKSKQYQRDSGPNGSAT